MGESRTVERHAGHWAPSPMAMRLCRCLLVLLLWHAGALWAATSASVRFTTYGPSAGLSQGSAIDILEDRQGFLWIGTQDGLNRFDGNDFRIFRHAAGDPATLSDNVVLGLAEIGRAHV